MCGRAVKTLPFLTSSPFWFSCFSEEPQRLEEEDDNEEEEEKQKKLAYEDVWGAVADLLVSVQEFVGQSICGSKCSLACWLRLLSGRTLLSMG